MNSISPHCLVALLSVMASTAFATEIDPIDVQLRTELQQLQASFDRAVQSAKAEAVRKYEAKLTEAERKGKTDSVNELRTRIAALKNEPPPKPIAAPPPTASELRVLGAWVLENAQSSSVAEMVIEKAGDDTFRLKRVGGGALAVSGDYKLRGDKLVKVPTPGDA
ncbi:MAG: hypothetical protein M3463_05560, partial [Verrucomicrobiota bacterium]|nr:hypothetical protein [Verrucomicrobiota bacterium]